VPALNPRSQLARKIGCDNRRAQRTSISVRAKRGGLAGGGEWLLATWRPNRPPSEVLARQLAALARQGCEEGRYWLRAYAALPDRLALLLYPLEPPPTLFAHFSDLTGGPPDKCRIIRCDAELERAAMYVESLPVRSQLALRPDEYPWSSAGWIHTLQH